MQPFNFPRQIQHATIWLRRMASTLCGFYIFVEHRFTNTTPLYYGYLSRYVRDHPPCTLVTYMDPISLHPTKNDVVCETIVRTIQVSKEMKQK